MGGGGGGAVVGPTNRLWAGTNRTIFDHASITSKNTLLPTKNAKFIQKGTPITNFRKGSFKIIGSQHNKHVANNITPPQTFFRLI